jgi:hypothetical protein
MAWDETVQRLKPYLIQIETQSGSGTGFLSLYNDDRSWCGIATAAHVVSDAEYWLQPVRLRNEGEEISVLFKEGERVILIDRPTDSAVILCQTAKLKLPEALIPLLPPDTALPIGADVGWLGYPAIELDQACFFSGPISARRPHRKAYLIDGVAINGVSGGPVFHCTAAMGVQIIGCVSAYIANRSMGDALPGLLVAQDVSHFHDVAKHVKNVDEAERKKAEFQQTKDEPDSASRQ